jgi:hypothetical protein
MMHARQTHLKSRVALCSIMAMHICGVRGSGTQYRPDMPEECAAIGLESMHCQYKLDLVVSYIGIRLLVLPEQDSSSRRQCCAAI